MNWNLEQHNGAHLKRDRARSRRNTEALAGERAHSDAPTRLSHTSYPSRRPCPLSDVRSSAGSAATQRRTIKGIYEVRAHFKSRVQDRTGVVLINGIWERLTAEVRQGLWPFLARESQTRSHFLLFVGERWGVAVLQSGLGLCTWMDLPILIERFERPGSLYDHGVITWPPGWTQNKRRSETEPVPGKEAPYHSAPRPNGERSKPGLLSPALPAKPNSPRTILGLRASGKEVSGA